MAPVPPARHLLRARDLADARYVESIRVTDMARAARLSPAHFSREFHRAFGEPPHRYLLTRRLERAAALLRTTDRTVADICFMVGLSSVGSFTTSSGGCSVCRPPTSELRIRQRAVSRSFLAVWCASTAVPRTVRFEKTPDRARP